MASPPFCPRGPSPKPLAPRVVNVRERGGRVQAGLQAGHAEAKAAKSCSYLCISQHPHPFAGFQRPKPLPLTGDSSLLHSAREGQEFWLASVLPDLSREACRRPCLQSPPEPGLPGPVRSEAGPRAAALYGLPHPCSVQGHRQLSHSPCSRSTFPLPPLLFPGPELGTSFYSCSQELVCSMSTVNPSHPSL